MRPICEDLAVVDDRHRINSHLAFSGYLDLNAFAVDPRGLRLYHGSEVLDVESNSLLQPLPLLGIGTGSNYGRNSIPGGPDTNRHGTFLICCVNTLVNLLDNSVAQFPDPRTASTPFLSDMGVSPNAQILSGTSYGNGTGRIAFY